MKAAIQELADGGRRIVVDIDNDDNHVLDAQTTAEIMLIQTSPRVSDQLLAIALLARAIEEHNAKGKPKSR